MATIYKIMSDDLAGNAEWWNNHLGWVEDACDASMFPDRSHTLPMGQNVRWVGLWADGSLDDSATEQPALPGWTVRDSMIATLEGWDIFDCDGSDAGRYQICRCDSLEAFDSDAAAWAALSPESALHRKALEFIRLHNPGEFSALMAAHPALAAAFAHGSVI